jgi:hypothetical protein
VIFSVPGTYRFILADNLETEAEFVGHQPCDVRFTPKADGSRPAGATARTEIVKELESSRP